MMPELNAQSIIKASAQFWEQMLAMRLEPVHGDTEICLENGHLCGTVQLSGVWTGTVEVRMAEALAQEATAAMLMQPLQSVCNTDTLDATKEIANMIAGILKSSLPRPCSMTVPTATIETAFYSSDPENSDLISVSFHHNTGDMVVRVLESEFLAQALTRKPMTPVEFKI
jgi:CheY-specific phosphatase CheX